jgi:hypothetical protein
MSRSNPYLDLAWYTLIAFSIMGTIILGFTGDPATLVIPGGVCLAIGGLYAALIAVRRQRYTIGDLKRREDRNGR